MNFTYFNMYLNEIRHRIIYIIVGYLFFVIILYIYKDYLLYIIVNHYNQFGIYYIYNNISDIITIYINIIFEFSLFIFVFLLVVNIYLFLLPGLYLSESKFYLILIFISYIYFYTCLYGIYHTINPIMFNYFWTLMHNQDVVSFNFQTDILSMWNFINIYYSIFIVISILYIVLMLIYIYYIIYLNKHIHRKYTFISCMIISSIINPGDIYIQFILSLFLILLSEINTIIIYIIKYYIYSIK